ncbi:FAA hydrolase family protein [Sporolactobacillus sp. THM7-4]|nr:FAA hydrolase family protein [Sporolactobacillus sp. THM7-4]
MKLLQFMKQNDVCLGVKTEHGIVDVRKAGEKFREPTPDSLKDLIASGESGWITFRDFINGVVQWRDQDVFLKEEELIFSPAVTQPEKIICIGLNYMNHAKESKMEIPESPILFSKFNNTLAAHLETIQIPEAAKKVDYEAELVMIIGKTAKNVPEEEALSCVFGYSAGNDISARDLQFKTPQWLLGKSPDGFAPVGPYVVTGDEIDPTHLNIECRINGEIRQKANTKDMIFNCATLVSYISRYMTLKPGDIIFTGTPDGVILGFPEKKQEWLRAGDEMTVTIESIGQLKNVLS